ncbi:hypothetical protein ABXJ56_12435 [Microbacterium chocolatum]|uniref:hypothetical protein n=1 Tax=Microbacterium aurantiacum TaxID=162393 RepID=UPI00338FFCEE
MNDVTTRTREIRLRNAARRQGLSLHKSRTRDPQAVSYGLFRLVDENNCIVVGGDLLGYSMDEDEIEVYLAGADGFDVYFANPAGAYSHDARPILEWTPRLHVGGDIFDGWMLTERSDAAREYFIARGRTELAAAVIEARRVLQDWAHDDAADAT